MAPEVSADDAGRRSDEAVRRLREESRRRVEGERRRRAFASWCAVATLASGISLAALNAHDARLQEEEAEREAAAALASKLTSDACWERDRKVIAILVQMGAQLKRSSSEAESAHVRAEAARARAMAINAAADQGCGLHVVVPSISLPDLTLDSRRSGS